ncbi:hypothetical protein [Hymenobacter cheonanensis]|uniref:hypothetical protein n=1 Tax=Hymenobacter sp. CA2-7 TaxID=3063993 RepID=UPI002713A39B|nr:hypothetical protein [Hymenobacter sp. CA2-7]MDO7886153.1 hypothetical protein [Hymenobacter sp. CA2-7]
MAILAKIIRKNKAKKAKKVAVPYAGQNNSPRKNVCHAELAEASLPLHLTVR